MWLDKILGSGAEGILSGLSKVIGKFKMDPAEKRTLELEAEKLVHEQIMAVQGQATAELQAKERVIVAELNQGDNYTKRARPTIIYAGLFIIFANWLASAVAAIGWPAVDLPPLPTELWVTWGAVTGTYAIGRSAEKRGVGNGLTRAITGSTNRNGILT